MAGYKRHRRRESAMSDGNAGVCRRRNSSRYPRNDLEPNARVGQSFCLLAPTPEHERVAALESHDTLPVVRETHQQFVDVLLARRLGGATALADVVQLDRTLTLAHRCHCEERR